MFKWLSSLFKKKPKEEPTCSHCGGFLKYHAWSDCSGDRAMLSTMSEPISEKTKAFYDRVGRKAHKENPDPLHGADGFTGPRGGGGTGCSG
jgi:hypothetical protein